jgi:hypothetical protein
MPTLSKSVHFRGEEQVIEAYKNRGVPAFALWQDKQFLFKYEGNKLDEGEALLSTWIEMLVTNQSSAIYTVCVYEDLKPGQKIKDKTPYDGSFNFRLFDNPSGYLPPQQFQQYQQQGGNVKVLLDKMNAQQSEIERLKMIIEEGAAGDEEEDSLGMVGKILEHPVLGPALQPLIQRLGGSIADLIVGKGGEPGEQQQTQMRRISGIEISDQQLSDAIEKLQQYVEDLPAVLEKLALIAEKQPKQFAFYKQMLFAMVV